MTNPFEDDGADHFVLVNAEGRHSLWPVSVAIPAGWDVLVSETGGVDAAKEDSYADIVAAIFASVIHLPDVPHDVSFFELGGSSLDAARVCTRLSGRFGVPVPVSQVIEHPTAAGVALHIRKSLSKTQGGSEEHLRSATYPHDPILAEEDAVALDGMQASFCVGHAFDPNDTASVCICLWELEGPVDFDALEEALRDVAERHEALRASYLMQGRPRRPIALVARSSSHSVLPITEVDDVYERLEEWVETRLNLPLDIAHGEIWRHAVLRSSQGSILGIAIHHVAFDGWSQSVLAHDLSEAYAARSTGRAVCFPTAAPSLRAIAREKQRYQAHVSLGRQKEYWMGALAGIADLKFPAPDSPGDATAVNKAGFHITAEEAVALDRVARAGRATRFTTLLAVYGKALRELTEQSDIGIGVPVSWRGGMTLDAALTCLINTVCVRLRYANSLDWAHVLDATRKATRDAMKAQDLSFLDVVRHVNPRRSGRNPFFQTLFALQDTPPPRLSLPGCNSTYLRIPQRRVMFELVLEMFPLDDGSIQAEFSYQPEKVSAAFVGQLSAAYVRIFRSVLCD